MSIDSERSSEKTGGIKRVGLSKPWDNDEKVGRWQLIPSIEGQLKNAS
jgi:hypothetical protein